MFKHQSLYLGRAVERHITNVRSEAMKWMYDNESPDSETLASTAQQVERSCPTGNGVIFCWVEESRACGFPERRAMVHRLQTERRKVILQNPVDLKKIPGASKTWDMPYAKVERCLKDAISINPDQENDILQLAREVGVSLDS